MANVQWDCHCCSIPPRPVPVTDSTAGSKPYSAKPRLNLRLLQNSITNNQVTGVHRRHNIPLLFSDTDTQLSFKMQKVEWNFSRIESSNYSTINTPYDLENVLFVQKLCHLGILSFSYWKPLGMLVHKMILYTIYPNLPCKFLICFNSIVDHICSLTRRTWGFFHLSTSFTYSSCSGRHIRVLNI